LYERVSAIPQEKVTGKKKSHSKNKFENKGTEIHAFINLIISTILDSRHVITQLRKNKKVT
jgi:hypothetical protein